MFNPNQRPTIENKESLKETKIDLHFFRHSIKSSDKVSVHDHDTLLSKEGRELAKERAYSDVNLDQSVAFGSKRVRAQETAGFVMAGIDDNITGTETMAELKEKLDKDLKIGSKIGIDNRLNFLDDESTPLGKKLHEAIGRGEYLKFIVEESDRIAKETSDTSGANYSRKAADIARIIEKYIKISPRWNKLFEEKSDTYKPTLERYLGTHQGMQESFLAKVIEKIEGIEARDTFIKTVGGQGFDFIEGFETEIITKPNKEVTIKLTYKKEDQNFSFEREIPQYLIQSIVGEDR